MVNQIKAFIILTVTCNTPKRVTSWRGPYPSHCTRATQLLSKKCRSSGEPLATMCPAVPIYVGHWGDNLQFYLNFILFSTFGGMKLDYYFFHVSKSSEDQKAKKQKKKVFTENWRVFSPKSSDEQTKSIKICTAQIQTIFILLGEMQSN